MAASRGSSSRPRNTITSIRLVGTSFVGGSPDGTPVGVITTTLRGGTFSGTTSTGGANGSSFRVNKVGSVYNLVTNGVVAPGSFSLNLTSADSSCRNSPFTQVGFIITGSGSAATLTESWNPDTNVSINNTAALRTVVAVGTAIWSDASPFTGLWAFSPTHYDATATSPPLGVSVVGPVSSNYSNGQQVSSGDTTGITSTGLFALVINQNRTVCVIINPNGPGVSGLANGTVKTFNATAYQ